MQVLKMVESRNEVQAILYTNLRISEGDNLEVRRQKRAIQVSVSRYLKSKRRCMEALIQNNFTRQDFYCTLTFTEARLPAEKVKADSRFAYFLRLLRAQGCHDIQYLKVLEHRHGDARFHFHVILHGVGVTAPIIRAAWGDTYGHAVVSRLRPWDVPGLAKYLSKEVPDLVNKRSYSRSRPPNPFGCQSFFPLAAAISRASPSVETYSRFCGKNSPPCPLSSRRPMNRHRLPTYSILR